MPLRWLSDTPSGPDYFIGIRTTNVLTTIAILKPSLSQATSYNKELIIYLIFVV